jgi:hypothetical protein
MAATTGTNIVKDGLVLNIDAANIPKNTLSSVEYLIVAGGGSGGSRHAGGGGGGGLLTGTTTLTPQAYTVTVGAGGEAIFTDGQAISYRGVSGSNSVAFGLVAIGGGGGGAQAVAPTGNGLPGGSGGGGGENTGKIGGLGTPGQGFSGGNGNTSNTWAGGGGGGGAGSPGQNAQVRATISGGNGGDGLLSSITGSNTFYAGGGGGAAYGNSASLDPTVKNHGTGGLGGGGDGGTANGFTGQPNTGGGGGGGSSNGDASGRGGNGGSGVVIIRYPGPQRATGGTVTQVGNDIVHTFTAVGSSTFTVLPPYAQGQAFTTTSDFSGQGNFGTAVNGPTYSTDGGGSFVFDGVDDYITIPHNSTISSSVFGTSNNFTLSSWVNVSTFQNWACMINKAFGSSYSNTTVGLWSNSGGYQVVVGSNENSNPGGSTIVLSLSAQTNIWYNIVAVGNGTQFLFYSNGNLVSSANFSSITRTRTENTEPITIGRRATGVGPSLAGKISTVSVYNRGLSAAEVQQNFEATRGRYGI